MSFILREGLYSARGGNLIWKAMEQKWICPGRTWQSLKNRFHKHTIFHLSKFGVEKAQLIEAGEKRVNSTEVYQLQEPDSTLLRSQKVPYSRHEDLLILNFIANKRRFSDVGGVKLWRLMEDRKVVGDRTWQSMKERFRKTILKKINSYDLTEDQMRGFA